ncbi:MbtH family NRPS accessory protein [Streptomyces sp. NPDC051572]|jgi:MbtH protein|uniref:MbtH family protein n=1 Tax=unclassified Streptomyces TaxID=2593676 RepID=UPI00344E87AC
MTADDRDPYEEYAIVMNDEEQYSIWPTIRELPVGWTDTGEYGSQQDCLDRIDRVWTDMRPRSLREAMERDASAGAGT